MREHPHGTSTRYCAGCRCDACRLGRRRYLAAREEARARADYDELVDATAVRLHVLALSRMGIGCRSIADAADVSSSVAAAVRFRSKKRIRASVAARILAVDAGAAADGARIDGTATRRLVDEMIAAGWTLRDLGERLGVHLLEVRPRRRVTVRKAFAVRRLHAEVMRALAEERELVDVCGDCGFSHAPERRHAVLRRLVPCSRTDVRVAHPCIWGGIAGERMMYRDLHAIGAVDVLGTWSLPVQPAQELAA